MTPEQEAVIDAVIDWRGSVDWTVATPGDGLLAATVDALLQAGKPKGAVAGRCNHVSPGRTMRCVLPNSHVVDGEVVMHEGRDGNSHRRCWKEYR